MRIRPSSKVSRRRFFNSQSAQTLSIGAGHRVSIDHRPDKGLIQLRWQAEITVTFDIDKHGTIIAHAIADSGCRKSPHHIRPLAGATGLAGHAKPLSRRTGRRSYAWSTDGKSTRLNCR